MYVLLGSLTPTEFLSTSPPLNIPDGQLECQHCRELLIYERFGETVRHQTTQVVTVGETCGSFLILPNSTGKSDYWKLNLSVGISSGHSLVIGTITWLYCAACPVGVFNTCLTWGDITCVHFQLQQKKVWWLSPQSTAKQRKITETFMY